MKSSMTSILLVLIFASVSFGQVPRKIAYQGYLTEGGTAVADGSYQLTFRLYDAANGGNELWNEQYCCVPVANGLFRVLLGNATALTLAFDKPYWLSVQVGSDAELSPRIELASVGYSLRSVTADLALDIPNHSVTTPKLADGAVTSVKIAANAVGTGQIADGAVTQVKFAQGVGLPVTGVAGGDLTGNYPNPTIRDHAVGTNQIADGAVTQEKLDHNLQMGNDTDWTISGNDIYRLNGNVGIGTTSPTHFIDIAAQDGVVQDIARFGHIAGKSNGFFIRKRSDLVADKNAFEYVFEHAREFVVKGTDFQFGFQDGRDQGNKLGQRAFVHGVRSNTDPNPDDVLVINYDGEFEAGVHVQGDGNTPNLFVSAAKDGNVGIGTDTPTHLLDINAKDGVAQSIARIGHVAGRSNGFLVTKDKDNNFQYIFEDGNVGIGSSNPNVKLVVKGEASFDGNFFEIQGPDFLLGTDDGRPVGNKKTQRALVHGATNRTSNSDVLVINWDGEFEAGVHVQGDDYTPNLYVSAAKDGNVGIGTDTPVQKLDVRGTIGSGGVTYHSDVRWKRNIAQISGALDTVSRLRGVRYEWRNEEFTDMDFADGEQLGVIAQEVEQVVPEVVSTSAEGFKAVDYAKLTALLIESVKELKSENQALKNRIDALEKAVGQNN